MLKYKATRATRNATSQTLQTHEAGRAGSTVHHQVFQFTLSVYVSLVRFGYTGSRELRSLIYFVIGFFVPGFYAECGLGLFSHPCCLPCDLSLLIGILGLHFVMISVADLHRHNTLLLQRRDD